MARKGRIDRGLVPKKNAAGQIVWHVRVGIGNGKEKWFGPFPTKSKAREHYQKCKHEQAEQRFNPERYQRGRYELLRDTIDRFLMGNTKKNQKNDEIYAAWWKTHYGKLPLNQMTPLLLEEAMGQLGEKGYSRRKGSTEKKKSYAPQTVLHYMKFLRHLLNLAIRDGKLERNPFAQVTLPKVSQGRTRFLSPGEEEQLLKALGPVYAPWARVAILTGMRKSEQLTLRWQDVDLEHGLVTLPSTKSGGVQYVHLNEEAKTILRSFQSWQYSPWVFPSKNPASHINVRNFYGRIYSPSVKRANLKGVTWHTLRHTFASRLAMNGQTEGTIATLLRHSTTLLVRRYAHLSPTHLQKAVEGISEFGNPILDSNRDGTVIAGEALQEGVTVSD